MIAIVGDCEYSESRQDMWFKNYNITYLLSIIFTGQTGEGKTVYIVFDEEKAAEEAMIRGVCVFFGIKYFNELNSFRMCCMLSFDIYFKGVYSDCGLFISYPLQWRI